VRELRKGQAALAAWAVASGDEVAEVVVERRLVAVRRLLLCGCDVAARTRIASTMSPRKSTCAGTRTMSLPFQPRVSSPCSLAIERAVTINLRRARIPNDDRLGWAAEVVDHVGKESKCFAAEPTAMASAALAEKRSAMRPSARSDDSNA
jgi:hypothetical protein